MPDYKDAEFDELYDKYSDEVYRLSRWYAGRDSELAEDATQHAFMELYIAIRDQEEVNSYRNFAMKVAKNYILNYLRHLKYEEMKDNLESDETRLESSPEEKLIQRLDLVKRRDLVHDLLEALKKKDELWHWIVMEVFVHERSQKEVAEELNLTPQALYGRIYRIREWAIAYLKHQKGV